MARGAKMVWICGPMRSGTSVLANLIRSHPDYVAGQANTGGENIPLMQLNRTLVQQFGGFAGGNIPVDKSRLNGPNRGAMMSFLDRIREDPFNWVLKDPRSCLTIGLWLGFLRPEEHHILVAIRHPPNIRQSYQATQPHNHDQSCTEIGVYYQMLFRGLAHHDHTQMSFFSYDMLMADPEGSIEFLALQLDVDPLFDSSLINLNRWHFRTELADYGGGETDAVQERETETLDVREQAEDGEEVGGGGEAPPPPKTRTIH